jgi:hypothetical protein
LVQVVAGTPPVNEIVKPGIKVVVSKVSSAYPVSPSVASMMVELALKVEAANHDSINEAPARGAAARIKKSTTVMDLIFVRFIECSCFGVAGLQ